jgi:hypothetical protein
MAGGDAVSRRDEALLAGALGLALVGGVAQACAALNRAEANPFDVDESPGPGYQNLYAASWGKAQELRRAILAEIGVGYD